MSKLTVSDNDYYPLPKDSTNTKMPWEEDINYTIAEKTNKDITEPHLSTGKATIKP